MVYLGSFFIILGLLQLTSVYFHLRGASLTGNLNGPGILLGFGVFTLGVWLAIDTPVEQVLVSLLISLPIAWVVLLFFGVITNLGWNPSAAFYQSVSETGASITEVVIPVRLTHIAKNTNTVDYKMPATLLLPSGWSQPQPVAYGDAVLVVCGAGDSRKSFKWRLFDAFLRQDMAVLTIDPPGHGDFQNAPMTVANGRAACVQALDWLTQQPGVKRVAGCGISFGGNLVADLGATESRLRCIATISAPVELNPVSRAKLIRETLSLFVWPRNIGLLREGSLMTLWCEYKTLKGAWFGEPLVEMIQSLNALTAFSKMGARPKLIVHGKRDMAVPFSNALKLYESSSNVRELILIPQATHLSPVLFPREMDQLAAIIKHWLDYNRNDAQQAL